jgi:hypothetical protein
MRKFLIVLPLAAALLAPSAAGAQTTKCNGHTYFGIDPSAFPAIQQLRAINLPRLTDGYAPRCLVAESVAGLVQTRWRATRGHLPRLVHPRGARWDGGIWRISYQQRLGPAPDRNPYEYMTARRGRQLITAHLTS